MSAQNPTQSERIYLFGPFSPDRFVDQVGLCGSPPAVASRKSASTTLSDAPTGPCPTVPRGDGQVVQNSLPSMDPKFPPGPGREPRLVSRGVAFAPPKAYASRNSFGPGKEAGCSSKVGSKMEYGA